MTPVSDSEKALADACSYPGDFADWLERRRKELQRRQPASGFFPARKDDAWGFWRRKQERALRVAFSGDGNAAAS